MMSMLKSLGRLLLGDEEQREIFRLSEGTFWHLEAKRNVINRTCIYAKASLTLERVPDVPFEFKLRIVELREDHGRAHSASEDAQMTFSLSSELGFLRSYTEEGEAAFSWKDDPHHLSHDRPTYEFVLTGAVTATTVEMFHFAVAQCIFSNRERKPHAEASDEDIQQLIVVSRDGDEDEERDEEGEGGRSRVGGRDGNQDKDRSKDGTKDRPKDGTKDRSKDRGEAPPSLAPSPAPAPGPALSEQKPSEEEIVVFKSEPALFYVFDASTGIFVPRYGDRLHRAVITVDERRRSAQYLNIIDDEDASIPHRQSIDPDATLHTDRNSSSFIWCYFSPQGQPWTFSLRFSDPVGLMGMSNAMGQAIYEILNEARLAEEDRSYFMNQLTEDVEMTERGNEPYIADSDVDESDEEGDGSEGEEDYEDGHEDGLDYDDAMSRTSRAEANRQLAVGYKHDRSFVSHGHSLSVFKHTADDSIQLHANIDRIQTKSGKTFSPTKMMLHEEDRAMVLMNADDPGRLYKMDLEYGKVVEDWQVNPEGVTTEITAILPDAKYAQMTSNPTFIGLSDSSLFRIDPRLRGSKRVESEMKQYAVKNHFTCGATTGAGELAVASAKGELRLFNKLDKRAKTLLPGFGDPIIGIDVTESGRWVIATCKTYLLFISTEIPGEDVLGFSRPMGANKPVPKRLQLKPEHIAYMNAPVSFTPARFSTGQSEERSIITSTGPYVVTWNLRRVKQGHLWDYQIRKYEDKVVADNFRYGQDRSIVVTLPHHVTMISKKSLATPSLDFFKKRGGAGGSTDEVVRTYK